MSVIIGLLLTLLISVAYLFHIHCVLYFKWAFPDSDLTDRTDFLPFWDIFWPFNTFILIGLWRIDRKHRAERKKQDRQMTSSRESNLGHRRDSCVMCRHINTTFFHRPLVTLLSIMLASAINKKLYLSATNLHRVRVCFKFKKVFVCA